MQDTVRSRCMSVSEGSWCWLSRRWIKEMKTKHEKNFSLSAINLYQNILVLLAPATVPPRRSVILKWDASNMMSVTTSLLSDLKVSIFDLNNFQSLIISRIDGHWMEHTLVYFKWRGFWRYVLLVRNNFLGHSFQSLLHIKQYPPIAYYIIETAQINTFSQKFKWTFCRFAALGCLWWLNALTLLNCKESLS